MSLDQFLLSADTTDLNYPEVRPTLDLNFARVKALDPRITFTRASGGSYVGADGLIKYAGVNEARFDHDPYTGESLGLLIEESRSNLLTRSSTPDTLLFSGNWGKGTNTTRIGTTTAPDGTNDAVIYQGIGVGAKEFVNSTPSLSANTTYTCTIWAKLISGRIPTSGNIISAEFSTGTVQRSNVPYANNLTTEWKRFSTTFTNVSAGSYSMFFLADANTDAQFAIWGAQLEQGSFPTSYIPTVASTRTRAADDASITGKNFSEWYRQDEGSIFVESYRFALGAVNAQYIICEAGVNINNNDNIIQLGTQFNANNMQFLVNTGNVNQVDIVEPSTTSKSKYVGSYKLNDFAYTKNGATPGLDTVGTVPTGINQFNIGSRPAFGNVGQLNGTISRLTYYPKRLPNAQLQALTR